MADTRRSRSRSPPPARDGLLKRRSRSPGGRDGDRRRQGGGGGFRWKEKRTNDGQEGGEKRQERRYRKRSRSPRRDREIQRKDEIKGASLVEDKFGVAEKFGTSSSKKDGEHTDEPPERPAASSKNVTAHPGEPTIVVHVNDRLGTKAAVPCLASDPIKLFKMQVAAMIGRQPHEILLKRQGERPFKDQLTLEDYGVSNGVQIDLEIDTGE